MWRVDYGSERAKAEIIQDAIAVVQEDNNKDDEKMSDLEQVLIMEPTYMVSMWGMRKRKSKDDTKISDLSKWINGSIIY